MCFDSCYSIIKHVKFLQAKQGFVDNFTIVQYDKVFQSQYSKRIKKKHCISWVNVQYAPLIHVTLVRSISI